MTEQTVKLKRVTAKNIKAIGEIDFSPEGKSWYILGKNGAGKSTVAALAKYLLTKQKPPQMLKNGEDAGKIELQLTTGETLRMVVTEDDSTVSLILPGGGKTSAAGLLKQLAGDGLTFDVNRFLMDTPEKKKKTILSLTGREAEAEALTKQLKTVFDLRTDANRAVKDQAARVRPDDAFSEAPTEPVEVGELSRKLMQNTEAANALMNLRLMAETATREAEKAKEEIENLRKLIAAKAEEVHHLETQIETAECVVLSDDEIQEITDKINNATRLNKMYEDAQRNREAIAVLEQLRVEAENADKEVEQAREKLLTLMKESDLPGGIEMTESGITLDGLPFDSEQISTSRRIIAGLEIAEKMIGPKGIRFLRLDATLLDEASERAVLDWATEKDLQLALEIVDRSGGDLTVKIIED